MQKASVMHSGLKIVPHQPLSTLCRAKLQRHPSNQADVGRPKPYTARAVARAAEETEAVQLPDELKNPVAVLEAKNEHAPSGKTMCYILGISHVSMYSCNQIEQLVEAVEPEVVMVELCKDRVGLLIDRNTQGTQTWHARKVSLTGATMSEVWPSEKEILSLCKAKRGHPIQVQDIEEDVFTLLSTGLFSGGRPMFGRANEEEAPAFMPRLSGGKLQVQSVPPLGSVEYQMRDRNLPPLITIELRVDSSLKNLGITEEEVQDLCSTALAESKDGTHSLTVYLRLRKKLLDICQERGPIDGVVIFKGEEKGRTEVIVRARKTSDLPFISGFEEGAEGGAGWGIDTFRPAKRPYKLSENMCIPQAAMDKIIGNNRLSDTKSETSVAVLRDQLAISDNDYRLWDENEDPIVYEDEPKGLADYFGGFITSLYGRFQSEAGRKAGVDAGAAWRIAMKSSVKKGVRQLLLSDMPTSVSSRHLAQSIFVGMGTRFALAAALSIGAFSAFSLGLVPDIDGLSQNATYATALLDTAILWPVFLPYVEIYRLSAMKKDDIEEAVKVKVPVSENVDQLLKLFGEDALLDWPGALVPVIDERDKYMARNLHAAATGRTGASPAFVQDIIDDKVVLRYMMPEKGPRRSAPMGQGDGEYKPIQGIRSVVGIVGSAHVRGMIKEWERLENSGDENVEEFLY